MRLGRGSGSSVSSTQSDEPVGYFEDPIHAYAVRCAREAIRNREVGENHPLPQPLHGHIALRDSALASIPSDFVYPLPMRRAFEPHRHSDVGER